MIVLYDIKISFFYVFNSLFSWSFVKSIIFVLIFSFEIYWFIEMKFKYDMI
jgi:hypothetical protein